MVLLIAHAVGGSGGDGGPPPPPPPGRVQLSLHSPSVHRQTFGDWMKANGVDVKSVPREQLDDVGVSVDYELQAPGYKSGTEFPVRFRILRKTEAGGDAFVDQFEDPAQLEVDSDSCTCTSSFMPIPRGQGRYRIEVEIFRPGPRTHSPLKKAYTESFLGFG